MGWKTDTEAVTDKVVPVDGGGGRLVNGEGIGLITRIVWFESGRKHSSSFLSAA